MALAIRLSRAGAKKRPFYRIVVAERRMPRDGRFIERVGSYNPMLAKDHAERVVLNNDRITHWLSKGAKPTDRVARFLAQIGLAPERKIPEQNKKNQPRPKTIEKQQEKAEKKKAAAEAVAASQAENTQTVGDDSAPEAAAESAAETAAETTSEAAGDDSAPEAAAETTSEDPAENAPETEEKAGADREETGT